MKYRLSLLEEESYRINGGICYCGILEKQILYSEEETDLSERHWQLGAGMFLPPMLGGTGGLGSVRNPASPFYFAYLEQGQAGSIAEP